MGLPRHSVLRRINRVFLSTIALMSLTAASYARLSHCAEGTLIVTSGSGWLCTSIFDADEAAKGGAADPRWMKQLKSCTTNPPKGMEGAVISCSVLSGDFYRVRIFTGEYADKMMYTDTESLDMRPGSKGTADAPPSS